MKVQTVEDLFLEHIRDLYDAEKHLVKALPKMVKAANSEELSTAIEEHHQETIQQVARLEQVFEAFNQKAKAKPCKAIRGLIEEAGEAVEQDAAEPLGDLAIIAAAQKVEHYEISAYGTARAMAEFLGNDRAVVLLEETEEEEKAADSKLTEIAMGLMQQAA